MKRERVGVTSSRSAEVNMDVRRRGNERVNQLCVSSSSVLVFTKETHFLEPEIVQKHLMYILTSSRSEESMILPVA